MSLKINKNAAKKGFLIFITPILVAVMQCNKAKNCENVQCTEEYRSIMLHIQYPDGHPVSLDSNKVFWVSENRYLIKQNYNSSYIIVDDGMKKELQNKKEVMRFIGYMEDKIVCERDVLVGADCCHVDYYGTEPLTQTIQY